MLLMFLAVEAEGVDFSIAGIAEKLTFLAALVMVVYVLWKLVNRLANEKDGLNKEIAAIYKKQAEDAEEMAANLANTLKDNTRAIEKMTETLDRYNELLEGFIRDRNAKQPSN